MAEPKPDPLHDEETAAFTAAVQKGLSSLDKGRSIPYEKIRRWLLSWGTEKELPPPECP
jgi:predicted transcriptional regulator